MKKVYLLIEENGDNLDREVIGVFSSLKKVLSERDAYREVADTTSGGGSVFFSIKEMDVE
jgi:hypothetical protein